MEDFGTLLVAIIVFGIVFVSCDYRRKERYVYLVTKTELNQSEKEELAGIEYELNRSRHRYIRSRIT